jgi:FkbM family methyltransferase
MCKMALKKELLELVNSVNKAEAPTVKDILRPLSDKNVFIYGAGSFGKEIFNILTENSINVHAFLDIKANSGDSLFNIPMYKAEDKCISDNIKNEAIVIFSIVTDKITRSSIIEYIKKCGFKNIINAQSIRCRFVNAEHYPDEIIDSNYLEPRKVDIIKCIDLWEDYESAKIYKTNVSAHITRHYDNCIESEGETQYFLKKVRFSKGFSRFIDCGGYVGDTLAELVKTQGKVKAAASFEPNNMSFKRLAQTAEKLRTQVGEFYLFPCGVSHKTEILSFKALGGSSAVDENGDMHVQCVALDDVLMGFAPTFIKMDVEGAEYRALLGAQKMIREYKPDMAICVYHCVNHLWDIPLMINSWNLGYKFFLRAHNACTMETVMYASCFE